MRACSVASDSLATQWTIALQASLSRGFLRQECLSDLPCPAPGDLPDLGVKPESPASPALQADSLPAEPPGNPSGKWTKDKSKDWRGLYLCQV